MSFRGRGEDERTVRSGQAETGADATEDFELEQALEHFRMSVHAWSDAAYSRPRTVAQAAVRRSWRLATGWALACTLAAVGVTGVGYQRHQRQVTTRIEAARAAEQQKAALAQQGQVRVQPIGADEEDLLAKVDSDVSREVPSAMEPLAQMMDDGMK
jgi:hypothetical protein